MSTSHQTSLERFPDLEDEASQIAHLRTYLAAEYENSGSGEAMLPLEEADMSGSQDGGHEDEVERFPDLEDEASQLARLRDMELEEEMTYGTGSEEAPPFENEDRLGVESEDNNALERFPDLEDEASQLARLERMELEEEEEMIYDSGSEWAEPLTEEDELEWENWVREEELRVQNMRRPPTPLPPRPGIPVPYMGINTQRGNVATEPERKVANPGPPVSPKIPLSPPKMPGKAKLRSEFTMPRKPSGSGDSTPKRQSQIVQKTHGINAPRAVHRPERNHNNQLYGDEAEYSTPHPVHGRPRLFSVASEPIPSTENHSAHGYEVYADWNDANSSALPHNPLLEEHQRYHRHLSYESTRTAPALLQHGNPEIIPIQEELGDGQNSGDGQVEVQPKDTWCIFLCRKRVGMFVTVFVVSIVVAPTLVSLHSQHTL